MSDFNPLPIDDQVFLREAYHTLKGSIERCFIRDELCSYKEGMGGLTGRVSSTHYNFQIDYKDDYQNDKYSLVKGNLWNLRKCLIDISLMEVAKDTSGIMNGSDEESGFNPTRATL